MYNDFVVCCPLYILATEDTFSPNNTFWLEKKKRLINGYIEHIYKLILLKKMFWSEAFPEEFQMN